MLRQVSGDHRPHKLACLIIGRNLGDAVIQSRFMRQLIERGYAERYVVWSRPQVDFLFASLPNCEVVTSPFPIGTSKQFDFKGFLSFVAALRRLRQLKPSVSFDMIGDFRERIFARLVGFQTHHHIGWESGHPFSRIIRNPFGSSSAVCTIPADKASLYQAYGFFIDALCVQPRPIPVGKIDTTLANKLFAPPRVGLHPFASQACKLWPDEHWRDLATWLHAAGFRVTAYGAPSEREALLKIFADLTPPPDYFTRSIPELDQDVAGLDLMIGLDSFSVHMAERNGVKSIMLNACNHPTLWVPPHCLAISSSGGCPSYPCMNVPNCEAGAGAYACIRSIGIERVRDAARTVLAARS